jgi:hypothetical protein
VFSTTSVISFKNEDIRFYLINVREKTLFQMKRNYPLINIKEGKLEHLSSENDDNRLGGSPSVGPGFSDPADPSAYIGPSAPVGNDTSVIKSSSNIDFVLELQSLEMSSIFDLDWGD